MAEKRCAKCGRTKSDGRCTRCDIKTTIVYGECPQCGGDRWDVESEWCFECHQFVPCEKTLELRKEETRRAAETNGRIGRFEKFSCQEHHGIYRLTSYGFRRKPKGSDFHG